LTVEVKSEEGFPRYISLEYEEFDPQTFFEEILPFVRTPHRCYNVEEESEKEAILHILIGITHPVEFKVKADKKTIKEIEAKLRFNGFKKAKWQWK